MVKWGHSQTAVAQRSRGPLLLHRASLWRAGFLSRSAVPLIFYRLKIYSLRGKRPTVSLLAMFQADEACNYWSLRKLDTCLASTRFRQTFCNLNEVDVGAKQRMKESHTTRHDEPQLLVLFMLNPFSSSQIAHRRSFGVQGLRPIPPECAFAFLRIVFVPLRDPLPPMPPHVY